jgi:hypothetical protein
MSAPLHMVRLIPVANNRRIHCFRMGNRMRWAISYSRRIGISAAWDWLSSIHTRCRILFHRWRSSPDPTAWNSWTRLNAPAINATGRFQTTDWQILSSRSWQSITCYSTFAQRCLGNHIASWVSGKGNTLSCFFLWVRMMYLIRKRRGQISCYRLSMFLENTCPLLTWFNKLQQQLSSIASYAICVSIVHGPMDVKHERRIQQSSTWRNIRW